jgi:uncharacterized protein YybS (DUF2232 family)
MSDIWIIYLFTLVNRRQSLRLHLAAMALPNVMTKVGMHIVAPTIVMVCGALSSLVALLTSLVALPIVRRLSIGVGFGHKI